MQRRLFSYSKGTSTTVLVKHVEHTHRINVSTDRDELKQQKLTDVFISKKKSNIQINTGKDERLILNRRLSLWLCKDLLPFSLVDNQGFQDFWRSLNVNINLPTRQTITIGALDDMYLCMKNELIKVLTNSGGKDERADSIVFSRIIYFYACKFAT